MIICDYTIEAVRANFEQRLREADQVRRSKRLSLGSVTHLLGVLFTSMMAH